MNRPMKFEIRDPEWSRNLQVGLEEYMEKLYKAAEAEETEELKNTESGIPFCACQTCEGREILAYIAPRVIRGYLDKKVGFAEVGDDWDGNLIELPADLKKHD